MGGQTPNQSARIAELLAQPPQQRRRIFEPAPAPGLSDGDFHLIARRGFGDGHNSFAHSMAWFEGRLFVGTTRSNFQMVKVQKGFEGLPVEVWPVAGPDDVEGLYRLDRQAEIWRFDPSFGRWQRVFKAPLVPARADSGLPAERRGLVARETGYRAMHVFQGRSDPKPALYLASWATSLAPGACIVRSLDGERFDRVSPFGIMEGLEITASRLLVPFKGRLFSAAQGVRGYAKRFAINSGAVPRVFETDDPASGHWWNASEDAFGDPTNQGIFALHPLGEQLYAATFNNEGFQLWRSDCEGRPPYRWTQVLARGGDRGPTNQAVASMCAFNGALYLGTGIQNGGNDQVNQIGPAGSELIRVWPDDSWDLLVGDVRDTRAGRKRPLSGLRAGFGNLFNGYFWSMTVHDGWLYVGTMDSTVWLRWLDQNAYAPATRKLLDGVGVETILELDGGCDLWRSADGENFIPVTRNGFGNLYNLGFRNLVSTPFGLAAAAANPFGPQVAARDGAGRWQYAANPRGGLEIWLGTRRFGQDFSEGVQDPGLDSGLGAGLG